MAWITTTNRLPTDEKMHWSSANVCGQGTTNMDYIFVKLNEKGIIRFKWSAVLREVFPVSITVWYFSNDPISTASLLIP